MRSEFAISNELQAKKKAYHDKKTSGKLTLAEDEKLTKEIEKLLGELNTFFVNGAKPIKGPDKLIGRRINGKSQEGQVFFEIGQGKLRSVGQTQEEAASNWNNKIYFIKKDGIFLKAK